MSLLNDENLFRKLLKNLNEARKNELYCDFVIKSSNGKNFPVHKIILTTSSVFFEKMLNSGLRESREDKLTLNKISDDNLEKIIEYMYTGNIEVIFENAQEIIDTALFLGFNNLVEFCTKILIRGINGNTIWNLLEYGKTMISEDLSNACYDAMLRNIDIVINADELKNVVFYDMKKLLERKNYKYDRKMINEEKFHMLIIKWIKYDIEKRRNNTKILIDHLKFEYMSKNYLQSDEIIETTNFIDDKDYLVEFLKLLRECAESNKQKQLSSSLSAVASSIDQSILYGVTSQKIYKIDLETKELNYFLKHYVTTNVDKYNVCTNFACVGFGKGDLFMCCGWEGYYHKYMPFLSVFKMEPIINFKIYSQEKQTWIELPMPGLNAVIKNAKGVYLNNQIYVYDKSSSSEYHIFDLSKCSWSKGSFRQSTIDCLCTLNDCLYTYSNGELYFRDNRSSSWKYVSQGNQNKNYDCEIIGYDNYIYQFTADGYCIFDTRMKRWFNELEIYQKDLENENNGSIKTFLDRGNNCLHNVDKEEWLIKMKSYKETHISQNWLSDTFKFNFDIENETPTAVPPFKSKIPKACLHNNQIYLYNDNLVQVYQTPNMDMYEEFPISYPREDYSMLYLISS